MTTSTAAATCGLVLFPLAMIYAGLMDLVTLKIRNTLVIAIGCGWLVLAPLAGFSLSEMGASAAVGAVVLVITFTFFALGWIGGGDAKLAAVTALWFRPEEAFMYFAYASVLGGNPDACHPAAADERDPDALLSCPVDRAAARFAHRRPIRGGDGARGAPCFSRYRLGGSCPDVKVIAAVWRIAGLFPIR